VPTTSDRNPVMPAAPPTAPPSLALRLLRPLGRAWLGLTGFRVVGEMPALDKFVIIAAPHTTNWDLPHTLAAGLHYGLGVNWMGKDSLFKGPFGGLMRRLGGMPVDRSQSTNAVAGMIATFAARKRLHLIIAPAGTRSAGARWKSGFYYIAHGAGVPVVLAFIDYSSKTIGVAGVFEPTGDYDADLPHIQAIYAKVLAAPMI
jgi:1-acyl-sn-glycerol-3-phosphate acyltransferase